MSQPGKGTGEGQLHKAAQRGQHGVIRSLIRSSSSTKKNIDARSETGSTALIEAAKKGWLASVKELLAAGANVSAADNEGWTAAAWAAHKGHAVVLKALLAAGGSVSASAPADSRTPLHLAAAAGHAECVVELLLAAGAEPGRIDATGRAPLTVAAVAAAARKRSSGGGGGGGSGGGTGSGSGGSGSAGEKGPSSSLKSKDSNPCPPQLRACLDAKDRVGATALHLASRWGRAPVVRVLLQAGADLGAADNAGDTPLHVLARGWDVSRGGHYAAAASALLSCGADTWAVNRKGEAPRTMGCPPQLHQLMRSAEAQKSKQLGDLGDLQFPSLSDGAAGAAGARAAGARSPAMSNSSSMASRPGSGTLDVKAWLINKDDLEILKQIGGGSYGRVFLAMWQGTLVAAKLLLNTGVDVDSPQALDQQVTLSSPVLTNLQKEAGILATLRHPNVVAFLGVCACPPYVITEYCSRGSLCDVLKEARTTPHLAAQLSWPRRLNMMLDAAKGMLHLHARNPPVLHRDLKSANLLVDGSWTVKVCDFNLSKILEENASGGTAVAINPRWLAPEVLAGGTATLRSDVFSYGIVCWEMLTWQVPFQDKNHFWLVRYVADGGRLEIPKLEELPGLGASASSGGAGGEGAREAPQGLDDFLALMRKCWHQDPEERPTFAQIIELLRGMLAAALLQVKEQQAARRAALAERPPSHSSSGDLTPSTSGQLTPGVSAEVAAAAAAAAAASERSRAAAALTPPT